MKFHALHALEIILDREFKCAIREQRATLYSSLYPRTL